MANVESNNLFPILIANLGRYPKTFVKNQVLATLLRHPTFTVPRRVLLANVVDEGNVKHSDTRAGTAERESNDNVPFRFKSEKLNNLPKLGTAISVKPATPPSLDEI